MGTRWWDHPRFDVVDTFAWRLGFCLLAISPFVEVMISAWLGHKGWLWVGMTQIYAWMAAVFIIEFRATHRRHKAQRAQWAAYEAELRRRYGLDND